MTYIILLGDQSYRLARVVTQTRTAREWENILQAQVDETIERLRDSVKSMQGLHGIEQIIDNYRSMMEHPLTRTKLEAIGDACSSHSLTLVGIEEVQSTDVAIYNDGWGNQQYRLLLEAALKRGEHHNVPYISLSQPQQCEQLRMPPQTGKIQHTKMFIELCQEGK